MNDKTKERYARAMEMLIAEVRRGLDSKIDDWLYDNQFKEFDEDTGFSSRPVPTTEWDAIDAVVEEFVKTGEDCTVDCGYFFEFLASEIFGFEMIKSNPYRKVVNYD